MCSHAPPQKKGGVNRRFQAKVRILKLAYYRNYRIHSNQILHIDKDHQTPFVGGPVTHTTNPTWRTAVILEKLKNRHISAAISTKFGKATQFDPLEPSDR